ncbi:unnamed protein product [Rotaria sordida]|uniref:Uncharacterized protein n=1 Tax=Rotaria sordida TaxID=392033 RepID=A0A814JH45_9BILA|nr:unnamed protein product [Rotaria sordida]CAF1268923.1 unnamed protein product [Rotaria sordida]
MLLIFINNLEHLQLVGFDAFVNILDGINKKRFCQCHQYSAGITCLAFLSKQNILAITPLYNYEIDADLQLASNDVTKANMFF